MSQWNIFTVYNGNWEGRYGGKGFKAMRFRRVSAAVRGKVLRAAQAAGNERGAGSNLAEALRNKGLGAEKKAPAAPGAVLPGVRRRGNQNARDGG